MNRTKSYMMLGLILLIMFFISGCSTTVPVTAKFPDVPNKLLEKCPNLQKLNDDYAVERIAALGPTQVEIFPLSTFYKYMEMKGKIGGQNKFPRVLRNVQLNEWTAFLSGKHK